MKSIPELFNKIKKENPDWSDYICLAEAISEHKCSKKEIERYFKMFVDPDDYSTEERSKIIDFLCSVLPKKEQKYTWPLTQKQLEKRIILESYGIFV